MFSKCLKKGYGNSGDGVIVEILMFHTLVPMDLVNICERVSNQESKSFLCRGTSAEAGPGKVKRFRVPRR